MNEGGLKQRLAAILAADAVGYSRLMEADERATVTALDAAKDAFRAAIDANQGHVINMAGDSVLALFDSAAGAVVAALAVQRTLDAAHAGVAEAQRLRFRIGIHLGDVIERADGDVYGDGVNIAARLQAIADPGGIVASEAVRGAVKSRVAATFDDRGMQAVKNISDPIRAFAVRPEGAPPPSPVAKAAATPAPRRRLAFYIAGAAALAIVVGAVAWVQPWRGPSAPGTTANAPGTTSTSAPTANPAAGKAALPLPGKPSIAVLPFDNMSGDAEQTYFADGITEDLITDLSKVDGLFVIARNSTFAYKGKSRDVREIAKALGVRYVLEGSVRRSGNDIRVNAQLIDATSGGHLWADRYDGDMKNIFGLQDTVTRNVVKALAVELTKDDKVRVAQRGTGNAQAYDVFLKGWERYQQQTPASFRAAIVEFKKAAELDPQYGRAYAALAATYWESFSRFWGQSVGLGPRNEDALYGAEQYLAKALKAPTPLAHQVASELALQAQRHDEAIGEAKLAIASDPNDAGGYAALAGALSFAGRPAEALDAIERAMRLNPHYPSSYLYQRGLAQFGANRVSDAAATLEQAIAANPDDYWSQRLLIAVYGQLGRKDDAERVIATMKRKDARGEWAFHDPVAIRAITYWYPFANGEDAKRFADGLRKAGVPE
jgi:TolB-like protein/class 3 adenylate cyclase/Flp pilus assembly protein TadD